jgi:hypothetical protein
MDRERLKEVRQTDLTESRVNEDFLDWLKNKGPTWLLVLLVAVTVYMGLVRWRQQRVAKRERAWAALLDASMPGSKEDVATEYSGIFAVPQIALDAGAAQFLRSVQLNRKLDPATPVDPTAPAPTPDPLSPEDRDQYLTRADAMFARVVEGDGKIDGDDGSLGFTLHAVQALFGRAAVAESRGDVEAAQRFYQRAAERAGSAYPDLAAVARQRAETVERFRDPVALPAAASLPPPPAAASFRPATVDAALSDLILPDETKTEP